MFALPHDDLDLDYLVDEQEFIDTGLDRGAGPSLFPDRVWVEFSVPPKTETWLREQAFSRGLGRAELLRRIVIAAQRPITTPNF